MCRKLVATPCLCVLDQDELCKLIKWVEDRIIRFYDVDERDALRGAGPQWRPAFEKVRAGQAEQKLSVQDDFLGADVLSLGCRQYLVDLGCPYKWSDAAVDQRRALRWVLSKAVACAYEDDSKSELHSEGGMFIIDCGRGLHHSYGMLLSCQVTGSTASTLSPRLRTATVRRVPLSPSSCSMEVRSSRIVRGLAVSVQVHQRS